MSNRQLALTVLTTATLAFHTPATLAYTLFQDSQTAANRIYDTTWVSPVDASLKFEVSLSNITDDLTAFIFVDNKQVSSSQFNFIDTNNPGILDIKSTLEVKTDSTIRFRVEPKNTFDFKAAIDTVIDSGLVFLGDKQNTFTHVGFNWNNDIYESHEPYTQGQYWDIVQEQYRAINTDNGVQKEHSFGSFLHSSLNPQYSPTPQREYIPIPELPGDNYSQKMKEFIETQLNSSYASIPQNPAYPNFVYNPYPLGGFLPALLNPYEQKCYYGQCTAVGLIERAAEQAGINGGQGFIPRYAESIQANTIFFGAKLAAAPGNCLTTFPITLACQEFAKSDPVIQMDVSVLSVDWERKWIDKPIALYEDLLQGWFRRIDFILTDPLGNQLGYRNGKWTQTGNIPGVMYKEEQDERRFYIPQRLPGNYSFKFFGCNSDSLVAIGNDKDGMLVSGCKEGSPEPGKSVPEPGAIAGLIATAGFAIKFLKRRTQ